VHHTLEEYLDSYIQAGGLKDAPKSPLFRASGGKTKILSERVTAKTPLRWCSGRPGMPGSRRKSPPARLGEFCRRFDTPLRRRRMRASSTDGSKGQKVLNGLTLSVSWIVRGHCGAALDRVVNGTAHQWQDVLVGERVVDVLGLAPALD
jgi:hypothetical protein